MAIALLLAGPARADSVWLRCDGLPKPEGVGVTVGRVFALSASFGLLGSREGEMLNPTASGPAAVAACTDALRDEVLTKFPARKANLLKFRALHLLESRAHQQAFDDADAITAAFSEANLDENSAKTLKVSSNLIKAFALIKLLRAAEAMPLVEEAVALRPYGYSVQLAGATLTRLTPELEPFEGALLTRLAQLDPLGLQLRADAESWAGNALAAFEAWREVGEARDAIGGGGEDEAPEKRQIDRIAVDWQTALAAQAAGLPEESAAYKAKAEAAKLVYATPKRPLTGKKLEQQNARAAADAARLAAISGPMRSLHAALEALAAGQPAAAVSSGAPLLAWTLNLSQEPVFKELIRREYFRRIAADFDARGLAALLPPIELRPAAEAYAKKSGFRGSGFSSKARKGNRSGTTVSFLTTGTSALAAQEMVLLRAAELTDEQGREAFFVLDRREFQRTLVSTYNGAPTGPASPAGFLSEIDVVFLNPSEAAELGARALAPKDVIAALRPIYVQAVAEVE